MDRWGGKERKKKERATTKLQLLPMVDWEQGVLFLIAGHMFL